ncbi:MAG TPA: triose-phosphate isomerase [Patescibacteria group bacterium]|nr:triose-phosphate isomerase [Patescibacteria group bacterium]
MRTPFQKTLVVGNWKMQVTVRAAAAAAREIASLVPAARDREVALAPPFTALAAVRDALEGSAVALAAQDLFWEDEGAYTGEISGPMLGELGATYVLVGHSERRIYLGETDHMINRKVMAALRSDLQPILCVGETEKTRASGQHDRMVREQVALGLDGVPRTRAAKLAIAWEPVWAIGTGRTASPADAVEMHATIRKELETLFPRDGGRIRILYGGSVTAGNVDALMACPDVDGVLVGGASLRPGEFARIAAYAAGKGR